MCLWVCLSTKNIQECRLAKIYPKGQSNASFSKKECVDQKINFSKVPRLDSFSDPVSHFGLCRCCSVSDSKRVPPVSLGWYFSLFLYRKEVEIVEIFAKGVRWFLLLARAISVAAGRCSGGKLAATLVAIIYFSFSSFFLHFCPALTKLALDLHVNFCLRVCLSGLFSRRLIG